MPATAPAAAPATADFFGPDPVVDRFLAPVGHDPVGHHPDGGDPIRPDAPPPDAPAADASPLTPRQAAFADAYARVPTGAAAARDAGYARASAKVAAARNLRRSGVLMRIMARRRAQASARESQRARIAGILDEALVLARDQASAHALARVAALLLRVDGLDRVAPGDDRMLADATEDQLAELLACYEVAVGAADPELPDPDSAPVEALAERALELMHAALGKAGDLPGVRAADGHLDGLLRHLRQGVQDAAGACAFARLVDEAAAGAADGAEDGADHGADHGTPPEPRRDDDDAIDPDAVAVVPAPETHPPLGVGSKAARAGGDAFGEGFPAANRATTPG